MSLIARCYNCNQKVYFDDRIRNGYGSAIRLVDLGEPHRCKHKDQKTGFNEPKNVSIVEKAYFLMLIMFPFQESVSLLVLILENLMYVAKHK